MNDHRQEVIQEDFQGKSKFLMDHFVQKLDSIYQIDNLDDSIQIRDKYLEEYLTKRKFVFFSNSFFFFY